MDLCSIYPKQFRNSKIPIDKDRCFVLMPFSEEYDKMNLLRELHSFIDNDICDTLMQTVYNMTVNQAQAALTAVQNLSYSIYKNPDSFHLEGTRIFS